MARKFSRSNQALPVPWDASHPNTIAVGRQDGQAAGAHGQSPWAADSTSPAVSNANPNAAFLRETAPGKSGSPPGRAA